MSAESGREGLYRSLSCTKTWRLLPAATARLATSGDFLRLYRRGVDGRAVDIRAPHRGTGLVNSERRSVLDQPVCKPRCAGLRGGPGRGRTDLSVSAPWALLLAAWHWLWHRSQSRSLVFSSWASPWPRSTP